MEFCTQGHVDPQRGWGAHADSLSLCGVIAGAACCSEFCIQQGQCAVTLLCKYGMHSI